MSASFLKSGRHPSVRSNPFESTLSQNWLWTGFGVLWLLDGLLQAKPDMFTTDFYALYPTSVMPSLLQQAAENQPMWLHLLMVQGIKLWGTHPVLLNLFSVVIELCVGGGMLFARARFMGYAAVWVGMLWSLIVWVFGQGMGGIFVPGANLLTGAPGSLLLYLFASLVILCRERWTRPCVRFVQYGLILGLGLQIFVQISPGTGYWSGNVLMASFANAAALHQPTWISAPISSFALWVPRAAHVVNTMMVAVLILFVGLLSRRIWTKRVLYAVLVWLVWLWWFAEDFGGIFSGISPDVGTIPPLAILFLYVFYGQTEHMNRQVDGGQ